MRAAMEEVIQEPMPTRGAPSGREAWSPRRQRGMNYEAEDRTTYTWPWGSMGAEQPPVVLTALALPSAGLRTSAGSSASSRSVQCWRSSRRVYGIPNYDAASAKASSPMMFTQASSTAAPSSPRCTSGYAGIPNFFDAAPTRASSPRRFTQESRAMSPSSPRCSSGIPIFFDAASPRASSPRGFVMASSTVAPSSPRFASGIHGSIGSKMQLCRGLSADAMLLPPSPHRAAIRANASPLLWQPPGVLIAEPELRCSTSEPAVDSALGSTVPAVPAVQAPATVATTAKELDHSTRTAEASQAAGAPRQASLQASQRTVGGKPAATSQPTTLSSSLSATASPGLWKWTPVALGAASSAGDRVVQGCSLTSPPAPPPPPLQRLSGPFKRVSAGPSSPARNSLRWSPAREFQSAVDPLEQRASPALTRSSPASRSLAVQSRAPSPPPAGLSRTPSPPPAGVSKLNRSSRSPPREAPGSARFDRPSTPPRMRMLPGEVRREASGSSSPARSRKKPPSPRGSPRRQYRL